jgi:hypothetical protein
MVGNRRLCLIADLKGCRATRAAQVQKLVSALARRDVS